MKVDRSRLPELGPDVSIRFPPVHATALSNGLRLRSVQRNDVPVVTLVLVLPTGSAFDPPAQPGLAAITADLLDEGTGDRDAVAMHEAVARIGAQLDIETGYDSTVVSISTLSRFHREAMTLLADMAFRPRLHEADFERVRDLRCNRLAQMRDVPSAVAEQAFVEHLFGAHPYGHLPIGTESALRAMSVDDVRTFHATRYRTAGALLIVVGQIAHEDAVRSCDEAFVDLPGGRVSFPEIPVPPIGADARRLVLIDRPGAPQSELRVGHLAVSRATPDYHPLVVLNALLGGQFVSRINLNLRENKGFTYGARSGFDWRRGVGPFVVQTSVQTDATAAAVAEILGELQGVAAERPPTERELTMARASLTRGFAKNFETADQVARALAQMPIDDLSDTWFDEFVDRVRAVDGDAVSAAARQHLRPAAALVIVVGDRGRVEAPLRDVGFATASEA